MCIYWYIYQAGLDVGQDPILVLYVVILVIVACVGRIMFLYDGWAHVVSLSGARYVIAGGACILVGGPDI